MNNNRFTSNALSPSHPQNSNHFLPCLGFLLLEHVDATHLCSDCQQGLVNQVGSKTIIIVPLAERLMHLPSMTTSRRQSQASVLCSSHLFPCLLHICCDAFYHATSNSLSSLAIMTVVEALHTRYASEASILHHEVAFSQHLPSLVR